MGADQKLYSTYLKGFENAVKPDGKLLTQISKCGTAKGRTSSSHIQKAIVAFDRLAGESLGCPDYSQSELRWIAHESSDSAMRKIFIDGGDMHKITGKGLAERHREVWENLSKEELKAYRQKAKPVNFGLPYGHSAKGFQAYARDQYGVHFTLEEAETYAKKAPSLQKSVSWRLLNLHGRTRVCAAAPYESESFFWLEYNSRK